MIKKYFKNIKFNANTFIIYLRLIIGVIFIYASLDKIANPSVFSDAIDSYEFSSLFGLSALNNILALSLPWLEMILGIFIIFGIFFEESINFLIFLLFFFIILLFQAHIRDLNLKDCGCGLNEASIMQDIIRDLVLLFACLFIKFRRLIIIKNRYDR